MKTLTRLFFLGMVVPSLITLWSCEKKNPNQDVKGNAEFSIGLPADIGSKSGTDSVTLSSQILISVEDQNGNSVFTDKLIPIYTFGNGFVSENIEIETGEYNLTKFMVINTSGEVVYASPLTGSPLAYLINHPLPLAFSIYPNQITRVLPEVLVVGEQTPDKFGYVSFGVRIVKPLEFWTMCVLDPGNPMIMAPIQITTAKLTVYAPDGWHYTFKLEAAVNHLIIRGGSEKYKFVLEKEGYLPQNLEFSARELLATTKENPLMLRILWESQYRVLVLQPEPEKGKDAMISNLNPEKNFGDYKYFEATFLSEPILTVMRSNRSLIWFNPDSLPKSAIIKKVTLTLTYDLPVPFDSTYRTDTYPSTGIEWYGGVFQQIVEPWEENKVTWNTQPKTIEANQVYLSPFIRNTNSINIDITRLYVPVTANALPNYGMLFKLWPVDRFPGFRFASSDYPVANMRPKLTIYYTL